MEMLRKYKYIKSAEFRRGDSTSHIVVTFSKLSKSLSLFGDVIDHCAKELSEIELEEVISILSREKDAMVKQRNFPPVYEAMLSDLIKVQRERYGVHVEKKVKSTRGYCVGIGKLEEILGRYLNHKNVHILAVSVGSDKYLLERIDLDTNNRALFVDFREVGEEDE